MKPFVIVYCLLLTSVAASGSSCNTGQSVPDCNCKVDSVDHAVKYFISPLLSNLTAKTFLRYFYVDLDKPCPFYKEDAVCMMEGCSVCACNETEIPTPWLQAQLEKEEKLKGSNTAHANDYGWISSFNDNYGFDYDTESNKVADSTLGKIDLHTNIDGSSSPLAPEIQIEKVNNNYVQHLRDTEDCEVDDWTALSEAIEHNSPYSQSASKDSKGVYVNLLNNPERFTGYGGPSARRVWNAILEENCFGELDDVCLEKRVFYRLMAGMRSSISTHIAKQYLFKDKPSDDIFSDYSEGRWGVSMDLYYNAVGNHIHRLNNMYFAFLFVLRAVVRAGNCLANYPYNTGNSTEDAMVGEMIKQLVKSKEMSVVAASGIDSLTLQGTGLQTDSSPYAGGVNAYNSDAVQAVEECKYGFDESELFQVSGDLASESPLYWSSLQEKQYLREQFRNKFRNISQIMDCVTCEKCRLWGKIQILGFGTAIKILLAPEQELVDACSVRIVEGTEEVSPNAKKLLNRQEIIALLNTLNQLSKSIEFVANINHDAKHNITSSSHSTPSTSTPQSIEDRKVISTPSDEVSKDVETSSNGGDVTPVVEEMAVTPTGTGEKEKIGQPVVTEDVVPHKSTDDTHFYARPNSTYASKTVPSRNKKGSDHSPTYRTALYVVFLLFAVFGFGLLLYSTYCEAQKAKKVK